MEMLSVVAVALAEAENATVPDTAVADFQAGVFNTAFGVDVRTDINACFKPDQNLADNTNAFIKALEDKDWATVMSTVKEFVPEVEADASVCHHDPTYQNVDDQWDHEEAIVKAFRADPDWQLKILKIVRTSMATIKADVKDATTKWDAGQYYEAGQAVGNLEKVVLAPWWNTPVSAENSTVPATAPADFQAGVFNTAFGVDVRTMINTCFTPDQAMADDTDAFIQELKDHDWSDIKATIEKFTPEAEKDASVCHHDAQYQLVDDQYDREECLVKAFRADPDWQLKLLKIVRTSMKDIKADAAAAETKWNAGDYYGAGQAVGSVENILFAPWAAGCAKTEFLQ